MIGWFSETNAEYHARQGIYSSTQIKLLHQHSPAYFKASIDGGIRREETEALRLGSIIHEAILEGDQFLSRYVIKPKWDLRTKEGKQKKQQWMLENEGKLGVTIDELAMIQGIYRSVTSHQDAKFILKGCEFEKSGYFTDPKTGIPLRIRPDGYDPHRRILVDIKSVKSIKREHFPYAIRDYRWDMSMALYGKGIWALNGAPPDSSVFIAVEKTAPYQCAVYEIGERTMDKGWADLSAALDKLSECLEKNEWPRYQERYEVIDLPDQFLKG